MDDELMADYEHYIAVMKSFLASTERTIRPEADQGDELSRWRNQGERKSSSPPEIGVGK